MSFKENLLYKTINRYDMEEPYLIAEIGINHNGDLDIAKELITISKVAGFDAVKFQKRNPEVCVPEAQKGKIRETPWGKITYLDYKYKVEFEKPEYDAIDAHCKDIGIAWSASPWDCDSVEFLKQYDLPWVKIASASIYDGELLACIGKAFDRVILSTGASDMNQVIKAYDFLVDHGPRFIDVLHCNSSYPSPVEDLNLNCITTLQNQFPNANVGYSGHEYGLSTTIATIALGANIIERHVTLDKNMWGSDQQCSLEPHAMFKLARAVREVHIALGDGEKIVTETEIKKMESLRG
jgi:N-acetylneuraminate synthase